MTELSVECCVGPALVPYLDAVARLRIAVFREWPYLYDGDLDYERRYLATYSRAAASLCVLVRAGAEIVGASTAVPMADETDEFKQPFIACGHDPARIFYFGESVLLPAYRGRGLGRRFFAAREARAHQLGLDYAAFCAVERAPDDPRRPADARSLEAFWQRQGYTKHPELNTTYVWKEIDEAQPSPKPMTFWLKRLTAAPEA